MAVAMKQILWFDDELGTERSDALAPWRGALEQLSRSEGHGTTLCRTLKEFAVHLRTGHAGLPDAPGPRFDLLIVDVMLTEEEEPNYGCLGFPSERLSPYDAGAQIASLLRSTVHDSTRVDWLQPYCATPLIALSSSPAFRSKVEIAVGHTRLGKLECVSKDIDILSGESIVARAEFSESVRRLLGR